MIKNLPTIRQSTEVALSRANTLMDVADKILAKQSTDLVDESWMERLWQWADDNDIDDEILPRDREGLVNLTDLNLEVSFDKEMENIVIVNETWDLPSNQLTELPKEVGNLVNLTRLNLFDNQLIKLPNEIGNLVNLTRIFLYNNQLTELPKEIGNLVNLTELHLGDNQLTKLPKEIGNLVNLTGLRLYNNQLTELPKEIGNLVNLTGLFLWNNQLTELPKEITGLTNLIMISFDDIIELSLTTEQQEWVDNIEIDFSAGWINT